MRIPAFLLVYTSLSGCAGGQLAELELEQQQLRAEYEDVAANVAALRDEMVELGLITRAQANAKAPSQGRSGKKIKPRGNPSPANDLSEGMPWTATRTGDKPTLPALADLERSSGDCGWRFHVRELQPISDFPLNRDGFGKASPVVMYEGDQPMSPHANPEDFEKACTGSYRHAGYLFLFSPTGNVDAASERSYRIELADEVPLPRDDGRPMYWVYPGTTLTFSVPGAWDPAWGEVRLDLAGRVMDFEQVPVTVRAAGFSEDLRSNGNFEMSQAVEAPTGAWSVEIASPPGGPYLLIDTLTVGNPENAFVMTSEATWVK